MGAQKNRLIEMVLLSTNNICFGWKIRKLFFCYALLTKVLLVSSLRAVEIPCPTCPTWSHFIQDKLKISIYLSLDKCKICYKVNKILYFIFD